MKGGEREKRRKKKNLIKVIDLKIWDNFIVHVFTFCSMTTAEAGRALLVNGVCLACAQVATLSEHSISTFPFFITMKVAGEKDYFYAPFL